MFFQVVYIILQVLEALQEKGSQNQLCLVSKTSVTPVGVFRVMIEPPRIAWTGKKKSGFWPDLGPGRLPFDSHRRDAKIAGVFASVAFLTVSAVPKSIFGIRPKRNKKVYQRKTENF